MVEGISAGMVEGKWCLVVLVGLVALGCGGDETLVRGRVVRTTSPTSYDQPVVLGSDSVARISLWSNPALGGDGISTLVVEQVLSPAPQPPFDFELSGPLPEPGSEQYYVEVDIEQHGSAATVGDLKSEELNVVELPASDVVVEVQGMESCGAANAGGFCL
jgi:hypothetical protein